MRVLSLCLWWARQVTWSLSNVLYVLSMWVGKGAEDPGSYEIWVKAVSDQMALLRNALFTFPKVSEAPARVIPIRDRLLGGE